jgi:Uma2 family endonuclease
MADKRLATYQDVLDAPEHMVAELIDGELFLSPRPGGPHSSVASLLGGELIPRFWHGDGGPGGWLIIDEPELHFGDRVLVPDLAAWRVHRMPTVPEGAKFTIVPDWICEISSPSTRRFDRKKKMPIYAAAGVGHFWWIEPRSKALEVMRRVDKRWLLVDIFSEGDKIRAEPFDEVEIDLARLWRGIPPRAAEESEHDYDYAP